MSPNEEQSLKADPFKWARWEWDHDANYWQDRLQNGQGLIRKIARFVIEYGSRGQG